MTKRDDSKPLYGRVFAFHFRCECGHEEEVDERTDAKVFDSSTGRFTCPNCWETGLLLLTLRPVQTDADAETSSTKHRRRRRRT